MIAQVAVVLCAAISLSSGYSQSVQRFSQEANIACDDSSSQIDECKRPESEATDLSWYHEEVFIRVIDGILTLELLAKDSMPKTVNAEGRGVVRVNRGFARIPSVDWFSLEENSIDTIPSSAFDGLPQLAYLNLARNRIRYLFVDSFEGLANLRTLILNHNELKGTISFIADNMLPALTGLYMQHNELEYINLNYGNSNLICNSNLRHLYLSNNSLSALVLQRNDDEACMMNLTHLYLEDNNLEYVSLGKIPLQALSLDRNSVYQFPKINPELKFLSMVKNRIRDINNFENAKNIVRIVLSYNQISNLGSSSKFQNLSSLDHVALDHNDIESIPDGFFYNLSSLRTVYITDNRIKYISPKAFVKLPALKELSFKNNEVQSFPGKELFGKSNITYLDFSCNKVENVSSLEANWIPKLKFLKLTGNPLKRIEPYSVSGSTTILL